MYSKLHTGQAGAAVVLGDLERPGKVAL